MKIFNGTNIRREKAKPGHYKYYNRNRRLIYDGSTRNGQHRLEAAFYGRADYAVLSNKKKLRDKIKYYTIEYMPAKKARAKDRGCKTKYGIY